MLETLALWALLCVPLFFFPGCPCCDEGGATCTGDTGFECFTSAEGTCLLPCDQWRVVLDGITNGNGSDCDSFNGTFDFVLVGGGNPCADCLDVGNSAINLQFADGVDGVNDLRIALCGHEGTTCAGASFLCSTLDSSLSWKYEENTGQQCAGFTDTTFTLTGTTFDDGDCNNLPASVELNAF